MLLRLLLLSSVALLSCSADSNSSPVGRLRLEKVPEASTILAGNRAKYMITVHNVGDVGLAGVEIIDKDCLSCEKTLNLNLRPGDSYMYKCQTDKVLQETFTNTAKACGHSILNPGARICSEPVSATVHVISGPYLSITKTVAGPICAGGTARFTIQVRNSGTTPLTSVTVTDALARDCDRTIPGVLAVGQSFGPYTCTKEGVVESFENTAVASATCSVSAAHVTDRSSVTVQVTPASISISKKLVGKVCAGGAASFSICVTAGCAALTDVVTTDDRAPACSRNLGSFAAGQTKEYDCQMPSVSKPVKQKIEVTGRLAIPCDTHPPTVSDSAKILVPVTEVNLQIRKTATPERIHIGDGAAYRITLSNLGSCACTNVRVSDSSVGDCSRSFPTLLPGAENALSYTCNKPPPVFKSFTNEATVSATCDGCPATDSDTAKVIVQCCDKCEKDHKSHSSKGSKHSKDSKHSKHSKDSDDSCSIHSTGSEDEDLFSVHSRSTDSDCSDSDRGSGRHSQHSQGRSRNGNSGSGRSGDRKKGKDGKSGSGRSGDRSGRSGDRKKGKDDKSGFSGPRKTGKDGRGRASAGSRHSGY